MTPARIVQRELLFRSIGRYFTMRYRAAAHARGHAAVAAQLRKQGVPLEVALAILFSRPLSAN